MSSECKTWRRFAQISVRTSLILMAILAIATVIVHDQIRNWFNPRLTILEVLDLPAVEPIETFCGLASFDHNHQHPSQIILSQSQLKQTWQELSPDISAPDVDFSTQFLILRMADHKLSRFECELRLSDDGELHVFTIESKSSTQEYNIYNFAGMVVEREGIKTVATSPPTKIASTTDRDVP